MSIVDLHQLYAHHHPETCVYRAKGLHIQEVIYSTLPGWQDLHGANIKEFTRPETADHLNTLLEATLYTGIPVRYTFPIFWSGHKFYRHGRFIKKASEIIAFIDSYPPPQENKIII